MMRFALFLSLLLSLLVSAYSFQTVYIHIGPYKTGTSHIQSFTHINRETFKENNLCWPYVEHAGSKGFLFLGRKIMGSDTNSDLSSFVKGFEDCFDSNSNVFVSSELFSSFSNEDVAKFAEFLARTAKGRPFQVKVIVTYREWLRHTYSMFSEREKHDGKVYDLNSFAEYVVLWENDTRKIIDRAIHAWSSQYGRQNIIALDYYGIEASYKDITDILFCEIMNTLCGKLDSLLPSEKDNVHLNQVLVQFINIFDNFLNSQYMKLCDLTQDFEIPYVHYLIQANVSFPKRATNMDLFKTEQVKLNREMYEKYGDIMLYQNPAINEEMINTFSLDLLDVNKIFQDPNWVNFMYSERKRLVQEGAICSLHTGNKITIQELSR